MKVSKRVKEILANSPAARDSDKELIRAFFASYGVTFTPEQERLLFSVSMEAITRSRRNIQSKGLYPANEGVRRGRTKKASAIRENYKKIPPEEIIEATPQQLFDDRFQKDLF